MAKKKKHNPGILDWIIDWFRDPIGEAIRYTIKHQEDIIKTLDPVKALKDAVRVVMPKIEEVPPKMTPDKIKSPGDAEKARKSIVTESEATLETMYAAMIGIEAGSIGLVDVSIDRAAQLPVFGVAHRIATELRLTPFTLGYLPFYRRKVLRDYTPMLPEPYRLALAMSKGILDDKVYKAAMAETGLDASWADMWREQNYEYPTLETALRLLRRGEISETEFDEWIARTAMPKAAREQVVKLKEVIPPLPDLILFAVREAFGAHTFEEQYPAYEALATKMGLTKEAAGWYWWSHWIRIMLAQMYDNYYRGYWTRDKFKDMLRLVDIHPDDRDDIINVAYRPLTIREMGYAYDVGAIVKEDIVKYRMWGGLSPEDADKAATALIDYRLSAEREAIRREHLHAFAVEKETEEEFRAALEDLMTPTEAIPLWIERGYLERERKLKPPVEFVPRGITRSTAQWLFEHGVETEAWFRETLFDLDTAPEAIEAYVAQSKQRIKEREKPPVEVTYRNLTVTQIRDLWRLGKIGAAEIPAFLEAIGYSPEDAVRVAQVLTYIPPEVVEPKILSRTDVSRMYDMRVYTEEQVLDYFRKIGYAPADADALTLWTKLSIEFPDLKAMYSKGWITADVLVAELIRLGLEKERAAEFAMTVVKAEQPARVETERDLTKAEIVKGWKKDVITYDDAVALLMDLNYENWEARYILEINRVVAAGDPEGYWEMRKVVEAYKKARGEEAVEIPDEVLDLERMIAEQKRKIEKMRAEDASAEQIAKETTALGDLEKQLKQLLIAKKLR